MQFPIRIFKVRERSMEPGLHEGDYVFASRWHTGIRKGDVVVAQAHQGSMLLVKRVADVSGGLVSLSGDNIFESRNPGPIEAGSILGKVILSV